MNRALAEQGTLTAELARGEYRNLLAWLREKIHRAGSRLQPQPLMQQATGEPTRSASHLEYLRWKFIGAA